MPERPRISVAIPARDQKERLAETLESIARSEFDLGKIEVVVVDDGSRDGTYETFRERRYPYAFRIVRADHANQSAATNQAVRLARGEYVLCSAQDIIFDEGLIREHLAWHERFRGEDVAVLGQLPYAPRLHVTPFMVYLVTGGFQFAYYLIKDPLRVPPNFVYAPNFSARREVLEGAGLFDPQFPFGCQDTDLGIRLVRRGVRIVYNAAAIGWHNHPMELAGYLRRQEITGAGLVRLQRKHPDYEGGPRAWDAVLEHYLGMAPATLDALHARVAALEPEVDRHRGRYEELWTRAFVNREPLDGFAPEERRIVLAVDRLFRSYNRILQHHWGRGYLEASLDLLGPERLREVVLARVHRNQSPLQLRRAVAHSLAGHGIEVDLVGDRDVLQTVVIHGIEDYAGAVRALEGYLDPDAQTYNRLLVVAAEAGRLRPEEAAKLEPAVEVVERPAASAALVAALGRSRGERVTLCDARVALRDPRGPLIAEKVLERFPGIGVLGGSVLAGDSRRVCGYGADGAALVEDPSGPPFRPVDSVIPEYCVLRASVLERALAGLAGRTAGPGDSRELALALCTGARECGLDVYHVPQLACEPVTGAPRAQEKT